MERVFIPEADIIGKENSLPIQNIPALYTHIAQRSPYFTFALEQLAASLDPHIVGKNAGWEHFGKSGGNIVKNKSKSPSGDFFSGERLCTIGAVACKEALEHISSDFTYMVAEVSTDTYSEYWDNPSYELAPIAHYLVVGTANTTRERFIIDPTYAQIDHRFAGRILFEPLELATDYYLNHFPHLELKEYILDGRKLVKLGAIMYGLEQKSYEQLVKALL